MVAGAARGGGGGGSGDVPRTRTAPARLLDYLSRCSRLGDFPSARADNADEAQTPQKSSEII